jgi:hypothetical protein
VRLSRADTSTVYNRAGWLTTVVARVCLDMLRVRERTGGLRGGRARGAGRDFTEDEALSADSVGVTLLVVLDSLEPAERLAFVLHDCLAVPFTEIAPIRGAHPGRVTPSAHQRLAAPTRRPAIVERTMGPARCAPRDSSIRHRVSRRPTRARLPPRPDGLPGCLGPSCPAGHAPSTGAEPERAAGDYPALR